MANITSINQVVAIIKQARVDQGLTQSKLASMVGMTQKKIATVETLAVVPRMDVLLVLMSALNLSLSIQSNVEKKTKNDVKIVWD